MGIRFYCPNGHKLNVKEFQAGRKGICPYCGAKMQIPMQSTRESSTHQGTEDAAPRDVVIETATGTEQDLPATLQEPVVGAPAPEPRESARPIQAVEEPPAVAPEPMPVLSAPLTEPLPPEPAPAGAVPAGTSDPLAQSGDVVWYIRPASGGQFGPATGDVMRSWIDEGRISADSLVWREGWRDWQEAAAVFPQLGAAKTESPLAAIKAGDASLPVAGATLTSRARVRVRKRSKSSRTTVIIMLVVVVLILFGVFLWVLSRNPSDGGARTNSASWFVSPQGALQCCFSPGSRPPCP